ncbi:hypothetical protein [Cellulomonas sp. HZM]|uniref:hypothetical protein n=1 Tax=Cellulomonas sp. HZM TaxID=1454010 RepID=UPI0009DCCA0F|nr:hypothetical protein [Cellulomonas sp. HZM]
MSAPLPLPRSVLLAAWWAAGDAPRGRVLDAVQGDDEPHAVQGLDGVRDLTDLLDAVGTPHGVAGIVTSAGDSVAAPAEAAPAAVDAGECVLVRGPGATLALVPQVERFGSSLEPGHLVTWRATEVPDWRTSLLGRLGSLQDADRDLRQGLVTVTEALVRLDVAHWREDDAARVAAARDGALPAHRLPPRLDGQRARVLASASRLRLVVELATQDDGAAVSAWQADQRTAALRDVDRMARRAMSAASTYLDSSRDSSRDS